jgi:hypothetical protein
MLTKIILSRQNVYVKCLFLKIMSKISNLTLVLIRMSIRFRKCDRLVDYLTCRSLC